MKKTNTKELVRFLRNIDKLSLGRTTSLKDYGTVRCCTRHGSPRFFSVSESKKLPNSGSYRMKTLRRMIMK